MGIFDFFKKKLKKDNRYNIDDEMPPVIKSGLTSQDLMTGGVASSILKRLSFTGFFLKKSNIPIV